MRSIGRDNFQALAELNQQLTCYLRIQLRHQLYKRRFIGQIILQQYFEPCNLKQKTTSILFPKEGVIDLLLDLSEFVEPITVHERVDVSPVHRPHIGQLIHVR